MTEGFPPAADESTADPSDQDLSVVIRDPTEEELRDPLQAILDDHEYADELGVTDGEFTVYADGGPENGWHVWDNVALNAESARERGMQEGDRMVTLRKYQGYSEDGAINYKSVEVPLEMFKFWQQGAEGDEVVPQESDATHAELASHSVDDSPWWREPAQARAQEEAPVARIPAEAQDESPWWQEAAAQRIAQEGGATVEASENPFQDQIDQLEAGEGRFVQAPAHPEKASPEATTTGTENLVVTLDDESDTGESSVENPTLQAQIDELEAGDGREVRVPAKAEGGLADEGEVVEHSLDEAESTTETDASLVEEGPSVAEQINAALASPEDMMAILENGEQPELRDTLAQLLELRKDAVIGREVEKMWQESFVPILEKVDGQTMEEAFHDAKTMFEAAYSAGSAANTVANMISSGASPQEWGQPNRVLAEAMEQIDGPEGAPTGTYGVGRLVAELESGPIGQMLRDVPKGMLTDFEDRVSELRRMDAISPDAVTGLSQEAVEGGFDIDDLQEVLSADAYKKGKAAMHLDAIEGIAGVDRVLGSSTEEVRIQINRASDMWRQIKEGLRGNYVSYDPAMYAELARSTNMLTHALDDMRRNLGRVKNAVTEAI